MKALVTGAAGFLGSHLVEALLANGSEVVALDHRLRGKALSDASLHRVRAVEADIFDADAVAAAAQNCDAIFHCAAIVGVDAYNDQPARTSETEETGLRHVCRAALAAGPVPARVIFASSSAVYGQASDPKGLSETVEVMPVSTYAAAKRFGELYLKAEHAERGLASAAIRIFNIYGPRQDERLVLPRFIRRARAGDPLEIFGDGSQTRDFVFVDDVVALMLAAASRAEGAVIVNACSGVETAIRDVAKMAIELTGSTSEIVYREQPKQRLNFEVARSFGNRERSQRLFGATPYTQLRDGLRKTIATAARPVTAASA